ncbi:MAG: citrate synthase, partial [Lachnospiraceae bacterium]|nr:citrate synthase [Lachnospiraceae bacterium]
MAEVNFREIIDEYVRFCNESGKIDLNLYEEYNVKRGLRDSNGRGVLTGLTEVSDVVAFKIDEGERIPIPGELYFQGYEVKKLVAGQKHSLYGFEEATYLLLFGELPTKPQLDSFVEVLGNLRQLPDSFNRDVIMKAPSNDMMNVLQKCVLTLYSYDDNPDDLSIKNVLKQCLRLIAQFPVMAAYGYQAYRHYYLDKSLVIHRPKKELSTAENILRLLRTDGKYTELEAKVLDVCLIIHAEHGGGNNSTFTTHVLSSTGTDTY